MTKPSIFAAALIRHREHPFPAPPRAKTVRAPAVFEQDLNEAIVMNEIQQIGHTQTPLRPFLAKDWLVRGKVHGSVSIEAVAGSPVKGDAVIRVGCVGWLDDNGCVWMEQPSAVDFDGGRLIPLLIPVDD